MKKIHKLCNKNNVKVIVDNYNKKLLNSIKGEQNKPRCNYRIRITCPIECTCMAENIVSHKNRSRK